MAQITSRRTVLAGLGTAAAASALAACSSGSGTDTSNNAPANTRPSVPAGAGASSDPAGGGQSLGSTADIPVGGGKIFQQQQVVVTQPAKGQLKCFTAVCTHMGCIVDDVTGGTINCACHGSKYSITDGSVVQGPAPKPLPVEHISVSENSITLNS